MLWVLSLSTSGPAHACKGASLVRMWPFLQIQGTAKFGMFLNCLVYVRTDVDESADLARASQVASNSHGVDCNEVLLSR